MTDTDTERERERERARATVRGKNSFSDCFFYGLKPPTQETDVQKVIFSNEIVETLSFKFKI